MTDKVTGGDLFNLWTVANVQLPQIAAVFTRANDGLAGTADGDSEAFGRGDPGPYGPAGGRVFAAFAPLRDEMQYIVAQTAQNILDAQTACNNAIEAYQAADAEAAADLRKNYFENPEKYDPNDPVQNPPTGEQAPGEPKPPDYYTSPGDR
ncbi:hypothetical protein [Phytomonospora endophytica]|uniref:Excreted virulence factor EspC (Type VII ESX diderm) n=1 Tax=Phytomonospora endophytica TaxID=714109 RepID=A0A841FNT5_9ACTN|nr:hypothetical protein [Phytomonospora endophytica]MBB6036533.1 hypothetical protein [Phytomonospora endophytica]GIG65855.1 hypothetical protein Pen01_21500 [Phytomonospora endophytica]